MAEPTDVIELLVQDHRALDSLLDRFDQETGPAERRQLYRAVVAAIAGHESAEETVVIPAVLGAVPASALPEEDILGQHDEINELLAEMGQLDPAGPGFEKRAAALVLDLRRHFLAEEEGLFPLVRAHFTAAQLEVMGEQVLAAKASAPPFPVTERQKTN
jgi:hemerythrin superfamily protein